MSVRLFGVSREGSTVEVGLPRRGNPDRTLHREITRSLRAFSEAVPCDERASLDTGLPGGEEPLPIRSYALVWLMAG